MRAKKARILRRIAGGFDLINECPTVILESSRKVFIPGSKSRANWEMQVQKVYRVGVTGVAYHMYKKLKKASRIVASKGEIYPPYVNRDLINVMIKNRLENEKMSRKEIVSL